MNDKIPVLRAYYKLQVLELRFPDGRLSNQKKKRGAAYCDQQYNSCKAGHERKVYLYISIHYFRCNIIAKYKQHFILLINGQFVQNVLQQLHTQDPVHSCELNFVIYFLRISKQKNRGASMQFNVVPQNVCKASAKRN